MPLKVMLMPMMSQIPDTDLTGQVGELPQRLPEGRGSRDRHHRPKEDHQGNPDQLRQRRKVGNLCVFAG